MSNAGFSVPGEASREATGQTTLGNRRGPQQQSPSSLTKEEILNKYNLSKEDINDSSFFIEKFVFTEIEKTWFFGEDTTKSISYINLAFILKYIEKNQNLFVSNNDPTLKLPYLKFDISKDNFMLTFYSHISADPRICLIPNNKLRAFEIDKEVINEFLVNDNEYIGRVMNLLINVEYLGSILFELANEKGEIILDSFLKRMLDDINKCLGGVNQLTYKVFDNIVKIIEEAPLKYGNLKPKQNYSRFNVYGVRPNEGSFIKNIDFNVTITNDMATMISVGAQANGNQPGVNSTAFSKFNTGLIDRTKTQITTDPGDPDPEKDTAAETEYKEANKKYKDAVNNVYFEKNLTSGNIEILNNFNSDFSKKYVGTLVENEQIPAPFFLPFDLNLTMMGLSGIRIFEKFALTQGSEKILPSYYRDNNGKSLIDFIVMDLKHSIKDNKWETMVKGRSIPSETSLEPKPVTKFTLSQEVLEAGLQATRNLTRPPGVCSNRSLEAIPPPIGNSENIFGTPGARRVDAMTKSFNAVFKNFGQVSGMCAQWTYNLALNYTRVLRGNNNIPQTKLAAGGNANQNKEYWNNLTTLGYTQDKVGSSISKSELVDLINNTMWNYGDIIVYYANDGETSESHVKYGHTQIYVGTLTSSKWSTSTKDNYGASFVYGSRESKCWDFYVFRSPIS
jgi:hypothetical protein